MRVCGVLGYRNFSWAKREKSVTRYGICESGSRPFPALSVRPARELNS